ncbi:MAG: DNA-binding protein WhiA [Actinomycetaceae bacterium]|nr:DNA-binding protein WhiA [Actinomycetaceae bacterium]
MSALTQMVKDELVNVYPQTHSAMLAEIAAMFRFGGGLSVQGGTLSLQAELTHAPSARHLWNLLHKVFKIEPEIVSLSTNARQGQRYLLKINDNAKAIARKVGIIDGRDRFVRGLSSRVVRGSIADGVAAWRGAFLVRGSLMEPGRHSGLEIICPSMEAAYGLGGLARRQGMVYRARESRSAFRLDVREGESIARLLEAMGAVESVKKWESLRKERELQGPAHRLANFDDANMRRSADAAVVAVIRVKRAFEILGDDIPDNLREAGEFRIKYPTDSLNLLGERMSPPATKDAVAGRLRRLNSLADKRADEQGIPDTMAAVREAQKTL